MRRPSRLMPKLSPRAPGLAGWLVILAILAWLLWLIIAGWRNNAPATAAGLGAAAMYAVYYWKRHREYRAMLRALATERAGESIGDFARAFDTREIDTWVIRAVYEQLQAYLAPVHANFPLRASDQLKTLVSDPDDLDMDLAVEIAERTGRSYDHAEQNPYYGRVNTVGDVVHFFNAQPRQRDLEDGT